MLPLDDDFSTNRHSVSGTSEKLYAEHSNLPTRHSDLCFNDGNLAVLTGSNYFLVHQGFLCRHSSPLASIIETLEGTQARSLEGRVVLELPEPSNDVYHFLLALYDGISTLKYDVNDFDVVGSILRLASTYEVKRLRLDILRGLSVAWPKKLAQWEIREANATNTMGVYEPRTLIPHPILIINLAQATKAPELLPAAFYDLSRCTPSECAAGYTCPRTSSTHHLSDIDLFNLLRGKEHGSRFLSTFVVSELEGREPSSSCIYRLELDSGRRRICQAAFEAITFEILRDINGHTYCRSSDPLFTILDAEMMQMRDDMLGRLNPAPRPCEFCKTELGAAVDSAREELWHRLPSWFGVDPQVWA